jgi:5-methylthioadenosine/S-adenosylhomocysteine deaminase
MPAADLLIRGASLVTARADGAVLSPGDLAIVGSKIVAIGPEAVGYTAQRTIDATDKIVFPGLVDTHTHLYQTLLKGLGDDLPLMEWLDACTLPTLPHLTPELCYVAAVLGCIESLRSGCTTVFDYMVEASNPDVYDAILQAFDDTGLQGVLGRGLRDRVPENEKNSVAPMADQLADCRRLIGQYGVDRVWLAPGATWALEVDSLKAIRRLATELGAHMSLHTDEVLFDSDESMRRFGMRTVPFLDSIDFLGPDVLHAHCVQLTENDCQILARRQGTVAYNPVSNMYLGSGVPPIPRLMDLGVTISLGADGAASNNSQDMLEALKVAALLPKVAARDPAIFTASDALRIATSGGAAALGRTDFGSLEVGKRADLFIFDPMHAKSVPVHDPVSTLVYASGEVNVWTTIVGGRIALDAGKIVGVDEAAVLRQAQDLALELAARAGTNRRLPGRWQQTRSPAGVLV